MRACKSLWRAGFQASLRQMIFSRITKVVLAVSPVLLAALAGCSEEPSEPPRNTAERSGLTKDNDKAAWLGVHDDDVPEEWLIARDGKALTDAKSLRTELAKAAYIFKESDRMIANRAVQLEGMLKAIGGQESAIGLITQLTEAADGEIHSEGFGAIGQHYVNLRRTGLNQQQALSEIMKRYGSPG